MAENQATFHQFIISQKNEIDFYIKCLYNQTFIKKYYPNLTIKLYFFFCVSGASQTDI